MIRQRQRGEWIGFLLALQMHASRIHIKLMVFGTPDSDHIEQTATSLAVPNCVLLCMDAMPFMLSESNADLLLQQFYLGFKPRPT